MKKILTLTSILAIVAACEPRNGTLNDAAFSAGTDVSTAVDGTTTTGSPVIVPGLKAADGTIDANPNSITLSNYTQAQQKIDRERYAAEIAAIAAQREEVTSVTVPTLGEVNPAKFARSSTNAVGVSIYPRSGKSGNCKAYSSAYEAQRTFLEAGGPTSDPKGLDKDGDGFACGFNPAPYRSL